MKLHKNKFVQSTFILMLSGMATKVLGLVIKILYTRMVSTDTIGLYSLVMPTYSLLLTIATFSMPTTIAKLISENNNPKVLSNASIIIFIINFILIFIMFLISPFIANNLLHNPDSYYLLIAMSFTLPFASFACILKGYFYGKQKMFPHFISNLTEQIIRLLLVIFIIPILVSKSYIYAACGLILTSFFTELASVIVFLLYMKKKDIIYLSKIDYSKEETNNILNLSIPSVSSRIIGNISYFLEPIILTNILLFIGYSNKYILYEYGAYNAYAISTLTIPSFFINAIALALIPEISKNLGNTSFIKKRLKQSIIFALILGVSFTTILFIFSDKILLMLYKTKLGNNYLKILSFFFILFYLENIFSSFMQAIGKNGVTLKITIFSSFVKLLFLFTLSFLKIGIYSLVISEIINIILVVLLNGIYIKKYLNKI